MNRIFVTKRNLSVYKRVLVMNLNIIKKDYAELSEILEGKVYPKGVAFSEEQIELIKMQKKIAKDYINIILARLMNLDIIREVTSPFKLFKITFNDGFAIIAHNNIKEAEEYYFKTNKNKDDLKCIEEVDYKILSDPFVNNSNNPFYLLNKLNSAKEPQIIINYI